MLNDFLKRGAPLEVPTAREIIPNIENEILNARLSKNPVIYCCDAHKEDDPEFSMWPKHAIEGTEGAQVIEQLKPQKEDYIVTKTKYSCFYDTSLDKVLNELGITQLIITGVVTNICILFTAAEAYMRGYSIVIPRNCVAALTQEEHQYALKLMKTLFNATVKTT